MQSDLLLGELGDQMYHFIHVVENDKVIGPRCPREHPKDTSDTVSAIPYFPEEALRVTLDRILRNFWLRMCTPHPSKGIPSRSGDI